MIPARVVLVRREVCARCDQPCEGFRTGALNHADPRKGCPREWAGRWGCYGPCTGQSEGRVTFGLGDAVEFMARPIVRASDALLGTQLKGCLRCGKKRKALNRVIPDLLHPFG